MSSDDKTTMIVGIGGVLALGFVLYQVLKSSAAQAAPATNPVDTTEGSLKITPKAGDMGRITVPVGRVLSILMPADAVTGSVSPNPETILQPNASNPAGQVVMHAMKAGFANILVIWTDGSGKNFQASLGVSVV